MVTIPSACKSAIQVRHACSLRASATRASDLERGYGRRMVPLQKSQHTDFKQLFDVRNWLRMVRNRVSLCRRNPLLRNGLSQTAIQVGFDATAISTLLHFIANSYLFVDFFFVLSGFVMSTSYQNRLMHGSGVGKFMSLRFGRVYPLHISMLACFIGFKLIRAAIARLAQYLMSRYWPATNSLYGLFGPTYF